MRAISRLCGVSAVALLLSLGGHAARAAGYVTADTTLSAPAAGKCGVCHPAERVAFLKSSHAREGVSCVACHGGNDQALTEGPAHAGLTGHISRAAVPKLCGSCHSNARQMAPYDLPSDQYSQYQQSVHGRAVAAGKVSAAICSDCHGAHDIVSPADPTSRTAPLNIATTCNSCHQKGDVTKTGPHAKAYAEYMGGVHGKELHEKGNLRAPTCVSCHGDHGTVQHSASGDIGKYCGQCHTEERKALRSGPHATALTKAGLPECASCHEDHATPAADPRNLATNCQKCHKDNPKALAVGTQMWNDYRTAAAVLDKATTMVEEADAVPINTEDFHARLSQARTYLREALPAAHAVQSAQVHALTARASDIGTEVQDEVKTNVGHLQVRKWILLVFWFYVLFTLAILRYFWKARH